MCQRDAIGEYLFYPWVFKLWVWCSPVIHVILVPLLVHKQKHDSDGV